MGGVEHEREEAVQTGPEKEEEICITIRLPFFGKPQQQMRFAQKVLQAVRLSVHTQAKGWVDWTPIDDKDLHKL